MLKFVSTFLAFLLLLSPSLFAKITKFDDGDTMTYQIHIDGVKKLFSTHNQEQFTRIKLLGVKDYVGVRYQVGAPEIPTISFMVAADSSQDIIIKLRGNKAAPQVLKNRIYPVQPSQSKSATGPRPFFINEASYKSIQSIPAVNYTVKYAGSIRGVPQQLVTLYPVKYNPQINTIKLTSDFTVEVKKSSIQPKSGVDAFLFIIGEKFKSNEMLAKYMQSKRELGYQVEKIVVTDQNNTPEQIRAAVQKIYNKNGIALRYALIIGDAEDVPGKRSTIINGTTDLYYRAIDTNNYDTDLRTPDIGLGRLTAKDNDQLTAIINKILTYQKGVFSSEEWLNKIAFIATNDKYQIAEGSHNYAIDNYTKPAGYLGVFPNDPQLGGDQLYAITHHVTNGKVVKTMREGRFIINYSGHGATTYWAGPTVKQRDVRSLNDPDARPFVISNACITGQFTIDESFAETWIRHPQGAILMWASMDSTYWDEDDILERAMYDSIFRDGDLNFTKLMDYSLRVVDNHYEGGGRTEYYWETYHVFGDPSLFLRTAPTHAININGQTAIPYGMNRATFTVSDDNGNPLAGVRVALYAQDGSDEYISSAISDETGEVKLALKDAPVGTKFKLTAIGKNARMYEGEVLITSANSPFLILKDVNVQGEMALHPFAESFISMNIKNVGLKPTTGGTLSIVRVEGPAEVLHGTLEVPALAANEGVSLGQLAIKVGDAQIGDQVVVTFKWELNEGDSAEVIKTFTILRGALNISSVDFGDPSNPQIGGISAGDSGTVFITVNNTGTADINNAVLNVTSDASCIANIQGELKIDHLAVGQSMRLATPFEVTLAPNCPVKTAVPFTIAGIYQGEVTSLNIQAAATFLSGRLLNSEYQFSPSTPVTIPDYDTAGVVIPFEINSDINKVNKITLKIDITHTYIGDIIIYLINPAGQKATVVTSQGGSADNMHRTFVSGFDFIAENLMDQPAHGTWKLMIVDKAHNDVGTLDSFKINIQGY